MNKKTAIILVVILALVLIIGFVLGGNQKQVSVKIDPTVNTTNAMDEVETADETEANVEENKDTSETVNTENNVATEATESDKTDAEKFIEENTDVGLKPGSGMAVEEDGDGSSSTNTETNTPSVDNTNNNTESVDLNIDIYDITYDVYSAMTADQQTAVMKSFGSTEDFMNWLNFIKRQYEAEHPDIEVGADGSVNLG